MFVYLSKKIAIPNGVKLSSLSWNTEHGWIACGGEGGLLKVLKLENPGQPAPGGKPASSLSMNQTLEGHNGAVMVVNWNEQNRKLTTSDEHGLIIVWMLHKGLWFEEMINNRNKSTVTDQKWNSDGQKICIAYSDGHVIVGSVDGNRLWGKETGHNLKLVEWAPDSNRIVFINDSNDVLLFDQNGSEIDKIQVQILDGASQDLKAIGIDWYDGKEGYVEPDCPVLAIGFDNGFVQIMRDALDDNPVLIDTGMQAKKLKWSTMGSVLAIAGSQTVRTPSGEERKMSMVQFYTPFGQHLRTLKVPGTGIKAVTWEGASLRIALAVDSFIYFANIRQDYKWGYFSNTLVYGYTTADRPEHCVIFWDTKTDDKYKKYVRKLVDMRAAGDNCVLAKADDTGNQYILILCNAIGSPVDSKYIEVEPLRMAMTETHVVVASDDVIYVWQYRTMMSKLTSASEGSGLRRQGGRERIFHVDDIPTASNAVEVSKFKMPEQATADPICCVAASSTTMIVGRQSGVAVRYSLPHITLEAKYQLRCRPQRIEINCNSTKLSIIDINGILTFFDMEAGPVGATPHGPAGERMPFERKDVWDMRWASDNPDLFAMMEKTRMYIMRNLDPEEPVTGSGYLCSFKDLMIETAQIDEIMKHPDSPGHEFLKTYETKSLRDTRDVLEDVDVKAAYQFVEDNPHPRLWRLIAEAALKELDFAIAEQSFVACEDYQGIQFVKRLRMLDGKEKCEAEICAYFKKFDEAEQIYRDMDRKDLAIQLRMRLGDWFRVVHLVQSGAGDDELLATAWNKIGDYYTDHQKWAKALQWYSQARNAARMVECYYNLDDYAGMEDVIETLAEGDKLLLSLGEKFTSVGMSEQAVNAFLRGNDVKLAIETCMLLNQWDKAVELAEENNFPAIEGVMSKYANQLLAKGKTIQAINLYRKANRHTETAKLLIKLARECKEKRAEPDFIKKIYVLAAHEIETYRNETLNMQMGGGATTQKGGATTFVDQTQQTLNNLMTHDTATSSDKELEIGWRGAEAYHFFMMAQSQLYSAQSSNHRFDHKSEQPFEACMRTSLRLMDYEDILDPVDVYSLIALTCYYNGFNQQCSRAFTKLETMDNVPAEKMQECSDLAMDIFARSPGGPKDPESARKFTVWLPANMTCVASGKPIVDETKAYQCKACRHRCLMKELKALDLRHCPLCHSAISSPYSR